MPRALEVVGGQVTFPGTTESALVAQSDGSFTVRSVAVGRGVWLVNAWADLQQAGTLFIRSPRMHDVAQGLRMDVIAGNIVPLLPMGPLQPLHPQDELAVRVTLDAADVAGDIEIGVALFYYEDLPGVDARLARWDEIAPRIEHLVSVRNTIATGTAGGFSGGEAIDEDDRLKANIDYAVLGYLVDTECAAVGYIGSDTGNVRVGGPGDETLREMTSDWFVRLSQKTGLPTIPVFNAANRDGFLVSAFQDENGADPLVNTILAQLS